MYWKIFDKERFELLKAISENISITDYYMIDGTALSLQLNLRESFDFDFAVQTPFNNELLLEELRKIGKLEVLQNQKGTCDVILNGVQVSFFYFPNKLIDEFLVSKEMPKLKLAKVLDIAVMKLVAIGGRGAKKDFFDLYNIIKQCNFSIKELAEALIKKYGKNINYVNIIMGLTYFEDAENEILPKTFIEYNWDNIKEFFIKLQDKFQKELEQLRSMINVIKM